MLSQKMIAVPNLSYLHISKLKYNKNSEKLFDFRNLVLLKGPTFKLKDKKK